MIKKYQKWFDPKWSQNDIFWSPTTSHERRKWSGVHQKVIKNYQKRSKTIEIYQFNIKSDWNMSSKSPERDPQVKVFLVFNKQELGSNVKATQKESWFRFRVEDPPIEGVGIPWVEFHFSHTILGDLPISCAASDHKYLLYDAITDSFATKDSQMTCAMIYFSHLLVYFWCKTIHIWYKMVVIECNLIIYGEKQSIDGYLLYLSDHSVLWYTWSLNQKRR